MVVLSLRFKISSSTTGTVPVATFLPLNWVIWLLQFKGNFGIMDIIPHKFNANLNF